jgi:hypothetical protein
MPTMPEPTTTAAGLATIAGGAASATALTVLGVPLGLRADLLIAGFAGSLVAIILLNAVPGSSDTWMELLRTTVRRMLVACASSLTAGYLTPLTLLGAAFATGGGAQQVLMFAIKRLSGAAAQAPNNTGATP